jgi:hypothetical protein
MTSRNRRHQSVTANRPKRPLSEAQLAQRRAAAPKGLAAGALAGRATGPRTEVGKAASSRNAWVHGRYSAVNRASFGLGAASISKLFGKPCQTTCAYHPDNPERTEAPCSLVLDGLTHAGGSCLDKTIYVRALDALMQAMQDGEMDAMNGLLAVEMASNLSIVDQVRQGIAEYGVMMPQYHVTKDGTLVQDPRTGDPLVTGMALNPALAALAKFTETHGINFAELLATPRARQKLADDDDAAGALQSAIGAIFARAGARLPPPKGGNG